MDPLRRAGGRLRASRRGLHVRDLVKRFGIKDRRVQADLHDGKFTRNEATGLDLAINGLVEATADDDELLARGMEIFEGLYAVLKQKT